MDRSQVPGFPSPTNRFLANMAAERSTHMNPTVKPVAERKARKVRVECPHSEEENTTSPKLDYHDLAAPAVPPGSRQPGRALP